MLILSKLLNCCNQEALQATFAPRVDIFYPRNFGCFADPLLQRQGSCRSTSDRKRWQENSRCGPRNLGHAREENTGTPWTQVQGLSTSAPSTRLYPQVGRQNDHPTLPRSQVVVMATRIAGLGALVLFAVFFSSGLSAFTT